MAAGDSAQVAAGSAAGTGVAQRQLLARMPLHAITSVYGEAGLRERLLAEVARFPATDRARIGEALELASRLHAADRRQREPYVNHLLRVTVRVLSHYRVSDADVACASLLHDCVEDHAAALAPGGTQQDALSALSARFGERVASLAGAVTNPLWDAGRDKHEQYREHVAASLGRCPWARVIKASDFTDNAVGLFHTTGPMLARLAGKYRPLVPVLRELVLRADTPLEQDVKDMIARQLDGAQQRFAAICGDGAPAAGDAGPG